jgi:hypothetical protein
MRNMHLIANGANVAGLVAELHRQPNLWNQVTLRTAPEQSPHHGLDDIWLRYNPLENYDPEKGLAEFNKEHDAAWYPAFYALPSARKLIFDLMRLVEGERLGFVLITRIAPGKTCLPHIDGGWHAGYYDKYAIQLESVPGQAFCFEDEALEAQPGDVYWFNNLNEHWVVNPTPHDRMTMIVCIRTNRGG